MTICKIDVEMPESGPSDWGIYLVQDENNPDKMGIIELRYSNELDVPSAVLITEDADGHTHYDDMDYTLLRYDTGANTQAGMFTVQPCLYPTIKLTVLVEQKLNHISIEIKREACYENHTEDDTDL